MYTHLHCSHFSKCFIILLSRVGRCHTRFQPFPLLDCSGPERSQTACGRHLTCIWRDNVEDRRQTSSFDVCQEHQRKAKGGHQRRSLFIPRSCRADWGGNSLFWSGEVSENCPQNSQRIRQQNRSRKFVGLVSRGFQAPQITHAQKLERRPSPISHF